MDNFKKKLENFKNRIRQLESSGGVNLNHKVISDPNSAHFGDKAVGQYAMMPQTVVDLVQKEAAKPVELQNPKVMEMNDLFPDDLEEYFKNNPDVEDHLFNNFATGILKRNQGKEDYAGAAYLAGSYLKPEGIDSIIAKGGKRGQEVANRLEAYRKLMTQKLPTPTLQKRQVAELPIPKPTEITPITIPIPNVDQRPIPIKQEASDKEKLILKALELMAQNK